MANTSDFFDFILPLKGEYRDAWWEPLNDNFSTIDTWGKALDLEIVAARFSKATLSEFLAVGHETDGNLKPMPEVVAARISSIYGFQTPEPELFDLNTRISQVEWEMWYSRESQANLRENLAFRTHLKNQIIDGAKDSDGYPTWLGYTGANVHIDGSSIPLWVAIDGKLGRARINHTVAVSGAAGTKYLYASILPDEDAGKIVVDGQAVPPADPNGATSTDVNLYPIYFNDATLDYTAEDVYAGDLLKLVDSSDKGNYVISVVAPGGSATQLEIMGQFPAGGLSSINYVIYDPLRMGFGVDTSEVPEAGKLYIGEIDFDGVSVTAVRARHFSDTFVSEWREIDVSSFPTFEEIFHHNLGSDQLDISVQVSASDDGNSPIEEMSLVTISRSLNLSLDSSGLTLNKNDTLSFNQGTLPQFTQGTFDPGTGDATHAADQLNPGTLPVLSGTIDHTIGGNVTGSITGDVYTDSSVKVQWTKKSLWVKNAESGKFYKSYSGSATQTGFMRVIVRKRG